MSIFYIEDKNGNCFSADGKRRFIRLKGKAAYDYLKSPNGRGKRFYRLSAEEETEEDVFIEIPSSKIGHIRKAERRTQYVADCKKESGRYEISLYALEANDHGERCTGEELIGDSSISVENDAIHRIQLEKLYQAVESLSDDERELITYLYNDEPMTVRELSKEWNIHYSTISRRHKAILRKLKRFLKNS